MPSDRSLDRGAVAVASRSLALVAVALLAGGVHALIRSEPILLTRTASPDLSGSDAPDAGDPPVPVVDDLLDAPVASGHITLEEAHSLWEEGAQFLDARREEQFADAHVAGAIWMSAARVASADGQRELQFVDPEMPVVIYCDGGECDASENAALLLEQHNGFTDIRIMGDGFDDWAEAGLPIEAPDSGEASP